MNKSIKHFGFRLSLLLIIIGVLFFVVGDDFYGLDVEICQQIRWVPQMDLLFIDVTQFDSC
jgi:hypothetical protein